MTNLFALPLTDRINYVKSIIFDIEQGTKLHNQENFITANIKKNDTEVTDCGTAFCIAGWIFNDCFQDNVDYRKLMNETRNYFKNYVRGNKIYENHTHPVPLDNIQYLLKEEVRNYLSNCTEDQRDIYNAYIEGEYGIMWAFACAFLEIPYTINGRKIADSLFDMAQCMEEIKENINAFL